MTGRTPFVERVMVHTPELGLTMKFTYKGEIIQDHHLLLAKSHNPVGL